MTFGIVLIMERRSETVGRWMKKNGRRNAMVFALGFFFLLSGCSGKPESRPVLYSPAQMNAPEYTIGVPQGAAAMSVVEKNFPKCKMEYYASVADGYLGVKYGKIDAFAFDKHTLQYVVIQNPDLTLMDEKIGEESIVVGAAPGREDLIKKVNAFIKQYRADGTYADMYNRWILAKSMDMPDLPDSENPALPLKIGTDGRSEPMSFYKNGRLTGFDIEFAKRLALFLNAECSFYSIEYPAIVTAATTGKIDLLISDLNATPERRKMMLFSDPYVDSEIAFLVRKDRLSPKAGSRITGVAQLAGKKVGIVTGSAYDHLLKSRIPGAVPEYFNNFSDQTEAVKTGKIAGFLVDEPMARDIMNRTSGLAILKELLTADGYAFAFPKNQAKLQKEVNAALKEMRHSGALQEIEARWFGGDESAKVLPDFKTEGKNGVIRLATNSGMAPFAYMKHGKMAGYDIEIARVIASKLGRTLEIVDMDIAAIIPSLITGKSDMAACGITVTEERAQSALFSIPNYQGGIAVMVAAGDGAPDAAQDGRWRSGLIKSFKRTFLVEDRYKLVLQGLWVTMVISIFSAIAGTFMGFAVCMARRAKTRWANIPAKIFIRAIQGTPIVVLLMILYYVVFGSLDINAILVAVIGFSINFAAYVSEMMRTGIDAVDKGQQEAAYAIGFNRFQVFEMITFPQAARHVLPVFKGEFISMLKMTSVVGYIAIQDLTKISDIIRSRTYEAFFPLIATALIYFVMAYAMAWLLSRVEIRVDPKRRKRVVKGVVHS